MCYYYCKYFHFFQSQAARSSISKYKFSRFVRLCGVFEPFCLKRKNVEMVIDDNYICSRWDKKKIRYKNDRINYKFSHII